MGKMSHDRVHITIRGCYLDRPPIRQCIYNAFGIPDSEIARESRHALSPYRDLHIICRPSQFARFIISRHVEFDQPNNMADLNMRLVQPEAPREYVHDVAENPNAIHYDIGVD